MPAVDLIPDECRLRQRRRKRLRFWLWAVTVVVCALSCLIGHKYLGCLKQDQYQRDAVPQYEIILRQVKAFQEKQRQFDSWRNQMAVLHELGRYVDYVKVMEFLTGHTPELVYLEKIKFHRPQSPASLRSSPASALPKAARLFAVKNQPIPSSSAENEDSSAFMMMTLNGCAVNHQVVADYLKLLSGDAPFAAVRLNFARRRLLLTSTIGPTIEFEIVCELQCPLPVKGEEYANIPALPSF